MHITSFFTLLEIWSLSCSYRYSVLLIRKSLFCDTMLIQAASSGLLCSNPFYHNLYLNLNIELPKTAKVQKHKDPMGCKPVWQTWNWSLEKSVLWTSYVVFVSLLPLCWLWPSVGTLAPKDTLLLMGRCWRYVTQKHLFMSLDRSHSAVLNLSLCHNLQRFRSVQTKNAPGVFNLKLILDFRDWKTSEYWAF